MSFHYNIIIVTCFHCCAYAMFQLSAFFLSIYQQAHILQCIDHSPLHEVAHIFLLILTCDLQVARLLGQNESVSRPVMEGIYEFERRMAEIYVPDEIQRMPNISYHRVSESNTRYTSDISMSPQTSLYSRGRGLPTHRLRNIMSYM